MADMKDLKEKSIIINQRNGIIAIYQNITNNKFSVSSYMYAEKKMSIERFIKSYNEEAKEYNNTLLRAYLYVNESQEKVIRNLVEENKSTDSESLTNILDNGIDVIH